MNFYNPQGKGGIPADFGVSDWVRAMKHGLDRDGKPLYLMPSHELSLLSESDMAAIIAYCSQLPPVDRDPGKFTLGPLGYILSEFGLIPLLPAEFTDHQIELKKEVKREVSAVYGKYLSTTCINCHGATLKGGDPCLEENMLPILLQLATLENGRTRNLLPRCTPG